jgi:signal transduction histidine kinase
MLLDEDAGQVNPAQQKMLRVIERNTERLRALIEDLLETSRIESGRLRIERVPVDLAAIVAAARPPFEATAAKRGQHLEFDVQRPLPVLGDASHLDRVLMNLVSNAVKFTPDGGQITVTARAEGDQAVIAVRDTGIGIPADDLPRLFTRFFRASNAIQQAIPGTGLGLPIVAAIIEQHHGTLTVDSREGEGTTFTLRLPLSSTPAR